MHIRPFQAVFPNLDYITSTDSFFSNVKEDYPDYKQSGFFNKASREGIYIYRISTPDRSYTGVIACAKVQDFEEGLIRKHENTLPEKEQRQMHLLLRRNAMVKPVLLTYPRVDAIDKFLQSYTESNDPFLEVSFDTPPEAHRLWEVTQGKEVRQLQEYFDRHVPTSYIADGHHRSSIISLMHQRTKNPGGNRSYDRLLSAFFPTSQLEILEYNRVVEGLNDLSGTIFMARLSAVAEIEVLTGPAKPAQAREIVLYINREWFRFRWKASVLDRYQHIDPLLDIHLLNAEVFEKIIGIEDIRTDERIRYVEGTRPLEEVREKVQKKDHRIGFVLFPVQMNDFLRIADAGEILPPKSTWFEPRMRNGLISQEF